jgi:hypothetical protein
LKTKSGRTFGKWGDFWKVILVLETYPGFGNPPGFWKPTKVLETYPGFGNLTGI